MLVRVGDHTAPVAIPHRLVQAFLLERHSRHHTSHASRVEKGSGAVTSSR